jgi:hypothetical protein
MRFRSILLLVSLLFIPFVAFASPMPPPPLVCADGSIGRCNPVSDSNCINPCDVVDIAPNPGPISPPPGNVVVLPPPNSIVSESVFDLIVFRNRYECHHPDGALFREHWIACGYTVDILGQKLDECLAALFPPAPPQGECDGSFIDGQGGALWKPISESTGKPVFLLPSSYCGNVSSTGITDTSGNHIVSPKPRYDGKVKPCGPNSNRAHYDVPMRTSELAAFGEVFVHISLDNGSIECRKVSPNASARQD